MLVPCLMQLVLWSIKCFKFDILSASDSTVLAGTCGRRDRIFRSGA